MHNEIMVMQVLRVPPMGKLVIEVNKQRYQHLQEIGDGKTRRLVLAAIGELISFAEGYQNLVDAGVAPPVTGGEGPAAAPSPAEQAPPSQEKLQTDFLRSLEAERDALRTSIPRTQEPSLLSQLRPRPSPAPPPRELNIVDQIDTILQKYVSADPSLAQRSIHLEQDPSSGGLRIEVDGEYYQRPAQIKDAKIQIYIKRALKEWDSS